MPTDAQIHRSAQTMMGSIDIPAVPLAAIQKSIALRRVAAPREIARSRRLAAAAAAFALVAFPAVAYSIASYEARSRAALQAHGGWAPPAPPAVFIAKLRPKMVTLAEARERDFALVAPVGLPPGTALTRIQVGAIGIYDRATELWRIGGDEAVFRYRRSDGGVFRAIVQRYDPGAVPGRYVLEDRGPDAHGNSILVRHENFAWRNGDQLTTMTADSAIGSREILTIARSMHGALLSLPWPSPHREGELRIIAP